MEGIDFDETFAPVARLKSIRILLAITSHLNFKLYQIDVKSAFLNRMLQEEVLWNNRRVLLILIDQMMCIN